MPLRCGEALCKKPVTVSSEAAEPWPILCRSCGCALFPCDILQAPQPSNEFWPQRGELMQDIAGRVLPCHSSEVIRWLRERERDTSGSDPQPEELLGALGRPLLMPRVGEPDTLFARVCEYITPHDPDWPARVRPCRKASSAANARRTRPLPRL